MKIIEEDVRGEAFVVAQSKTEALRKVKVPDQLITQEKEAIEQERYNNRWRRDEDEPLWNTYKITFTVEQVH